MRFGGVISSTKIPRTGGRKSMTKYEVKVGAEVADGWKNTVGDVQLQVVPKMEVEHSIYFVSFRYSEF